MKIKIINPNTSVAMTEALKMAAVKHASPGTQIIAVNPLTGPAYITSYYAEAMCASSVLAEIMKSDDEHIDGFVLGAYVDPFLFAAREIVSVPVVGIGEASMLMACMLGYKFSIITVSERLIQPIQAVVRKYGLSERCASIRATTFPISDIEEDREKFCLAVINEGRKAIEEDRAEVLLLGGSIMSGLDPEIEKVLHAPVIDGAAAAVKFLEALHQYGKATSKIGTFRPPDKTY